MNDKAMGGRERGPTCRTIVRCTACWLPMCMYFLMCLLCVAKAAAVVTAVQPSGPPVASTLPQVGVELFPPSALSYDKSLLAKVAASKQSYTMTTRSGSKYSCYLPPTDQDSAKDAEGKQKVVAVPSEEELLAPLQNTCLYRLTGWWTYELCHGRTIRQFHSEGEKTTAEFLLGKAMDTSTSARQQPSKAEQNEEEKQGEEASNPEQQQEPPPKEYYLERFEGGTICDLTGAPRTAEVHWHCAPGEKVGAVLGLKEPFTCHYVFSVGTSLLCAHPSYRSDSPEVHTIACIEQEQRPLDDKVEVEGENVMQEAAEVAEKKIELGAILSSQDEEDQRETSVKEEKTKEEVLAEIDFIAPPPWEDREDEDIF
ncbi:Protein OS-9 [Balamuthia mandrillaris]